VDLKLRLKNNSNGENIKLIAKDDNNVVTDQVPLIQSKDIKRFSLESDNDEEESLNIEVVDNEVNVESQFFNL